MASLPTPPFRGPPSAHDPYPSRLQSPADTKPFQQPAFDRRPSQSDSDVSDPYTPNSHLDLLEPTAPYPSSGSSRNLPDATMANGGSALLHQSPYPSYQAPFGAGSTRGEDDTGASEAVSEDPNSTDFAQTFYDPFRIKHRRRTSPPQLKILEYHFDRNPKPDVTLRKNLSEQLDMTPREVQVWFQNRRAKTKKLREKLDKEAGNDDSRTRSPDSTFAAPPSRAHPARTSPPHAFANLQHNLGPDYNSMRRGSSPAVLSAGLTRFDGYYEPTAPPPPHSFASHGGARPAPYHPPSSMYPSPMSLSNSGLPSPAQSPNELIGDFHQVSPAARAVAFDDPVQNGRRFSLPAYGAGYPHPASGAQWFPTKEAEDHSRFAGSQLYGAPPHHPNPYPPLDYNQAHGELDFGSSNGSGAGRSPDFGFGAPRDDGSVGGDYSPSSSSDEPHGHDSAPGSYGVPGMSQYTFGSATRWEPDADQRAAPLDPTAAYPGSSLSPLDQTSPGGRRSSCPAGFVPHFDNLGLASPGQGQGPSPVWAASYAPPYDQQQSSLPLPPLASMQKRHSYAAPYSGSGQQYTPAPNAPLYAPLPINPAAPSGLFPQKPQFAQNGRRGSTSSALGTIVEQPSGLAQFAAVEDGQASPHSLAARKSRSQASLRATPPYPSPQDRAERRSPLLQERRASVPSGDYLPLP